MLKSLLNNILGMILMKEFIYPEMMIHVPLCTNKNPKDILIISNDAAKLIQEVQKHYDVSADVISCNVDALRDAVDAKYDVVVCELDADAVVIAHVSRVLKEDGLVVCNHPSLDDREANRVIMKELAKYFKIIMPYNLGEGRTALLASKEYHPTADIILQRADMLDNLSYYNSDIHPAAFAMGNYIRKEYLGIIKN